MRIVVDDVSYYIHVTGQGKPLVCFHGFSESGNTWDGIEIPGYAMYRLDFIGHGQSDKPLDTQIYQLPQLLRQLHIVIQAAVGASYSLMGYSMGARIALLYALQYQHDIEALILESGSVGIQDPSARKLRFLQDEALAKKIVRNGRAWFRDTWSALPIFKTQQTLPLSVQDSIRRRRFHNEPYALHHTLMGSGQGCMPYVGHRLDEIMCPSLYISGALDKKYSLLGEDVFKKARSFSTAVIQNVGHNTHLERPREFERIVAQFLHTTTDRSNALYKHDELEDD